MGNYAEKLEDLAVKEAMATPLSVDDFSPIEFLSMCLSFSDEHQYKDGWNYYTFAAKFNRKPTATEIDSAFALNLDPEPEFMSWLHRMWREQRKKSGSKKRQRSSTRSFTQYLVRRKGKGKAHLWDGNDTACRMYSTGGLSKKRYVVADDGGRKLCGNCVRGMGG